MSIDRKTLAAYADGELGPEERALVEAAIAADPALAQEVEAHRTLRAQLSAHFAPILDMPLPERLTAPLVPPANVVDLAGARAAKEEKAKPRFAMSRWAMGGAIAASLALGMLIGVRLPGGELIEGRDGTLVASGALDKALTTQLASAQDKAGPGRILLSFKAEDGRYCRGFEIGAMAGIACRQDNRWALVRTQAVADTAGTADYRQAGSASADILAAAQDMAAGEALDAGAERSARDAGWRD